MIARVGSLVGAVAKTEALIGQLRAGVAVARRSAAALPRRPRVYFEEWPDPQIS